MTAAALTPAPKVGALLPWYGGKRTLAPRIVQALGDHSAYWELFCGSMAVLFAKPESSHETVNDLHGDLTNLAWVLQSPAWTALYDRCARSVLCEGLFLEAIARLKEPLRDSGPGFDADPERAYWYFIRSWWGRNGTTGATGVGAGLAVRFTPGGGHGGVRFRSVVDSMPAWHERLRSILVLRSDAFELVEKIEDVRRVAIYADPPYLKKTVSYLHDFESQDHQRLAMALRRFKRARVVVSYYDHPRLAELYPDWQIIRCTVTKAMVSQGQRSKGNRVDAPEVLLVNHQVDIEPNGDRGLFA